ncbi:MAG: IclR family transcriptional regulator [Anaerolineales bacterium]|nr:IclR family transcriptional regulator [Anaerolineales bacterium]
MKEIQSLARGLKILTILSQSAEGCGITELAELLNIDKASASRLAATLANYGFVEKDDATRLYRLGPTLLTLSRSMIDQYSLIEQVRPFLRSMMEQTGECAHLAVSSLGSALYIAQEESPRTLRVNAEVGTMNPLHCTALGKILLAFDVAELPAELPAYTQHTITDRNTLLEHLKAVHDFGYALDMEEFDIDIRCIAVPVFNVRKQVVAAIGISGPASRLTDDVLTETIETIVAIGVELSEQNLIAV